MYVGRSIGIVLEPRSIATAKAKRVREQKRKLPGYVPGDTTDEEDDSSSSSSSSSSDDDNHQHKLGKDRYKGFFITEVFMNSGAASRIEDQGEWRNERRVTSFRELNEFEKAGLTPTSTVDHGKDQWLYFVDG